MRNAEQHRLEQTRNRTHHWRRWGPYLSERQWGTVREDYSTNADPWTFLPHDAARSYAYRWGEDGLLGISDNHQRLCFAPALWNGQDPILKERFFGVSNKEGNHGEDVKEYYWYEDNTPTHAYMRAVYRYPQHCFPYEQLVRENLERTSSDPEFECVDTGIFEENRFFDVTVEYAKADVDDVLMRISITNCGPEAALIHLLPMLWFRNTWSWRSGAERPRLRRSGSGIEARHHTLGTRYLSIQGYPDLMFTDNETNRQRLYNVANPHPYVKDAFHYAVVYGDSDVVKVDNGTKFCAWYRWDLAPGATQTVGLRLASAPNQDIEGPAFDEVFDTRSNEAGLFYDSVVKKGIPPELREVQRHALAGMLWTKQWYHYVVEQWLEGDPLGPPPPAPQQRGRNQGWKHLYNDDVLSMPDKWEFPWYAVWDVAFHALPLALVDPEYAKRQLTLFTREWYMHPNGQLPAYEWDFDDVNPPVHAWAAWQVYEMERQLWGIGDRAFLESVFHKMLMNFTWWVNRKDAGGNNVFQGGFLGMDNLGVFDRSAPPPTGGYLEQSDTTSWMAMYCLDMLEISWELAKENATYEDIASKFFEHFLYIADAIYNIDGKGASLWDEEDGFFYDQINRADGHREPVRLRSMVGLVPLLAVGMLDSEQIDRMPGFKRRMEWFFENRADLTENITCRFGCERESRMLLSLMRPEQLKRVLERLFDEDEFLSPYGVRSLSKAYADAPFVFEVGGFREEVRYEPAESVSPLFGGNSNWRGPVWFPMNFLIIRALQRYHAFWGDEFAIEFPTGSGEHVNLATAAEELSRRLVRIFAWEEDGQRPVHGRHPVLGADPAWKERLLFYEYFHGDNGAGLGASHQTGWTGLVANLINECRY